MVKFSDAVERRIVIEYGRKYAVVSIADRDGKIIDQEAFTQPYVLDRKESQDEAKDAYDVIYDWMNDTINYPTAGLGGEDATPEV